eukprot:gene28652-29011_t
MATINGTSGVDELVGTSGADVISGLSGDDQIIDTLGGADQLRGGDGNDILTIRREIGTVPGAHSVTLDGGAGDDDLYVHAPDLYGPVTATMIGGSGNDIFTIISTRTLILNAGIGLNTPPVGSVQFVACAIGKAITVQDTPTLSRMLDRIVMDAAKSVAILKSTFNRPRPMVGHDDAPLCLPREDWMKTN